VEAHSPQRGLERRDPLPRLGPCRQPLDVCERADHGELDLDREAAVGGHDPAAEGEDGKEDLRGGRTERLDRERAQALLQRADHGFVALPRGGMEAAEQHELVSSLHDAAALDVLAEWTQAPADLVLLDPRRPVADDQLRGCFAHGSLDSTGRASASPASAQPDGLSAAHGHAAGIGDSREVVAGYRARRARRDRCANRSSGSSGRSVPAPRAPRRFDATNSRAASRL
jgi:hypothetical protein